MPVLISHLSAQTGNESNDPDLIMQMQTVMKVVQIVLSMKGWPTFTALCYSHSALISPVILWQTIISSMMGNQGNLQGVTLMPLHYLLVTDLLTFATIAFIIQILNIAWCLVHCKMRRAFSVNM